MNRPLLFLVPLVLGTWLWACADDPEVAPPTLDRGVMPLPVAEGLLYLGTRREQSAATIVRVAGGDVRVSNHALPEGEVLSLARPGKKDGEVVLLTSGRRAQRIDGEVQKAVNAHVLRFDARGERARYELTGQYSRLALSDDGRYAIAFAPSEGVTLGDLACVVDLGTPPDGEALPEVAIGHVPLWFSFAPAAAGSRRLAVAAVPGGVSILDLARPAIPPLLVELSLPGAAALKLPQQVIFRGDQLFIRTAESPDVTVLQLREAAGTALGFRVAPSSLSSEVDVSDMALTDAEPPQLITVGSGRARVVDPVTGIGVGTELDIVDPQVVLFEGEAPRDQVVRTRAVAYATGQAELFFLDFGDAGPWVADSSERVRLSAPAEQFLFMPDKKVMLLVQEGGFAIVDLEARTVAPVAADQSYNSLALEEADSGAARLWLTDGSDRVALVDLDPLRPRELLLNAGVQWVVPLAGDSQRIALVHPSDTGHFTLVDAARPEREGAVEVVGFAWAQLFN